MSALDVMRAEAARTVLWHQVREFMAECVKAVRTKHGDAAQIVVLFDSIEDEADNIADRLDIRAVEEFADLVSLADRFS